MPSRSKKNSLQQKRSNVSRNPQRSLQNQAQSIPRLIGDGMPNRARATLRYCEQVSLNPGVGSPANYYFRANDCYDPNLTGTGHQPKGFDQLMSWYNHFTVERSRIRVTIQPPSLTGLGVQMGFVGVYAGATDLSSIQSLGAGSAAANMMEARMQNHMDFAFFGSLQLSPIWKVLKTKFDFGQWFGPKADPSLPNFQGDSSSSPTEGVFFGVTLCSWDNTADTDAALVLVDIEYDVIFAEPKILPNS